MSADDTRGRARAGAAWAAYAYLAPRAVLLFAQAAMAALWPGIRVLFLIRVPAPELESRGNGRY